MSALAIGLSTHFVRGVEPTWNYAVQVSAAVQISPPQITLSWPQDTTATPSSYTVYRKAPAATSWGGGTTLPGSTTSYADTGVTGGTAYEYAVVKNAGTYNGYGYIESGINVPLVENRGKVVLIVDSTYAANLSAELSRLQQDLAGDGWIVLRHDVGRSDSVVSVKNLIKADYNTDPVNVKSVFLFGHVPVPYSGQLNPDGHPDHVGAWPADVYYGDMDGNWTDNSVNYTQTVNTDPADAARLTNVPGDGKFDQTAIPSAVELQVGRVDLANMPGRLVWGGPATFPSEQELLRQYLNKDHNFRHRITNAQRRGVVADYFGVRNGEAFSASAYRGFSTFFGPNNISNLNAIYNDTQGVWVPALATNDFLCAYGCGAGSYSTISGLGNGGNYNAATTPEIVNNNVRAVFTLLFGSWNGDWDHEDDFLRSILATKDYGLAAAWSGRPHWFIHPMGLGETIGYCARLTQNNNGFYQNQINSAANYIHIALMGDPTLRLHTVAPVGSLGGTAAAGTVTLAWTPSPDSPLGYHVYRALSAAGPFTRLSSSPLSVTSFLDASAPSGATYMVRAVKLENTPSGSYYNASQGTFWSAGGVLPPSGDTTAPTVTMSAPVNGATVSGSSVTVSANATDNVGVTGV
ncbi:MAG TPA: Ig-like domain-containing protein, partial [Candidatus Angelobacter sp.]|nr:Ig-like domain-containing protein [Candidatus Angelobacter sp.]